MNDKIISTINTLFQNIFPTVNEEDDYQSQKIEDDMNVVFGGLPTSDYYKADITLF